jgi:hypothetical protein
MAMCFTACKKDNKDGDGGSGNGNYPDDGTFMIDANSVTNSSSDIVTVKAVAASLSNDVLATSKYRNGFRLMLPKTLDEELLYDVWVVNESLKISDPDAKEAFILILAFDKKDEVIGQLCYAASYIGTNYVYADRNFTITGKYSVQSKKTINYKWDCSFKKGWNIMYYAFDSELKNCTITTTKPSGETFKWYYMDDDDLEKSTMPKIIQKELILNDLFD